MILHGVVFHSRCLITGREYIGQTTKIEKYLAGKYVGSGIDIKKDIKEHRIESFVTEDLEWCYNDIHLDDAETFWIRYYDAVRDPKFYNRHPGGQCGRRATGWTQSEETKAKLRAATALQMTPELRAHLAEKSRNRKQTQQAKDKVSAYWTGRPKPPGLAEKVAKAQRKWYWAENDGQRFMFHGLKDFCKMHNLRPSHMCNVAKGHLKHHKGWTCGFHNPDGGGQ